jgi:hypothetical protein
MRGSSNAVRRDTSSMKSRGIRGTNEVAAVVSSFQ